MDHHKSFINELGNKIQIETSKKKLEDVDGILIKIIGPTSDTEIHITHQEAEILLEELDKILRS